MKTELSFMKRTIEAHCLGKCSLYDAKNLLPGLEPSYFDAEDYADKTSFFESRNILIDKENYIYPPLETFTKSFEKWFALQKHDVEAVNSLHEWLKAVG